MQSTSPGERVTELSQPGNVRTVHVYGGSQTRCQTLPSPVPVAHHHTPATTSNTVPANAPPQSSSAGSRALGPLTPQMAPRHPTQRGLPETPNRVLQIPVAGTELVTGTVTVTPGSSRRGPGVISCPNESRDNPAGSRLLLSHILGGHKTTMPTTSIRGTLMALMALCLFPC
jgi:hypothetical protein